MLVDRLRWFKLAHGSAPTAEGRPMRCLVKGKPLVLVRWQGTLHALDENCPHHGASLSGGRVSEGCIICPRHLYHYDLLTGRGKQHDGGNAAVYPVQERSDGVYVGFTVMTLSIFGRDLW